MILCGGWENLREPCKKGGLRFIFLHEYVHSHATLRLCTYTCKNMKWNGNSSHLLHNAFIAPIQFTPLLQVKSDQNAKLPVLKS